MLIDRENSCLILVDAQERLLPALEGADRMLAASRLLLVAAARLGVPVLATEQYPKGLGRTVPALAGLLPAGAVIEKLSFNALAEPEMQARVKALNRPTAIVAGAETHVCVLQTAFGLQAAGYRVVIAADAVASRAGQDYALGLARMREACIVVATSEMVAFEWLGRAGTAEFRDIIPLIKSLKDEISPS
ncbi:MAG: isochorismatase family protein [Alphaproteobacteria bacterium]|nr:isochorismatase family protein [Alphaproteobacteria bacterium]MBU0797565.1 isochorismatase family protein [Alphaproteobacteria bacterium]MBU0885629.1 isochorismatase family protein [Alphaproteobacteria bacterium]MBU1812715.1 isochorismatase family protein [Alphaproteobacteria bacterium]